RIEPVLLPLGEGPKGRMRVDLCPHPPLRGTLSRRERDLPKNGVRFLRTLATRRGTSHPSFTSVAPCSRVGGPRTRPRMRANGCGSQELLQLFQWFGHR